jgi:hypothetical protein
MNTETISSSPPSLPASSIEVLPDPIHGWLTRKENEKPEGARFWPATDQQGAALDCDADILLLGGSAGSLKTSTILADLIQEREYPRMNSYFFRKTYPELEDAMQQAMDLFPQTGARSRDDGREYVWPSGAHFRFRHLSLVWTMFRRPCVLLDRKKESRIVSGTDSRDRFVHQSNCLFVSI